VYAIKDTPSFFDFLSYVFYCGGTISGPFYEYKDFDNFINKKDIYVTIPNTMIPTIKRFLTAFSNYINNLIYLVFVALNAAIDDYFVPGYIITEEFGNKNFIYKVITIFINII
jgi:hypothetical protein